MAIFQPTSIIPSSFTQGTVDVNDNMEISWQVNGNSAMTAFQIDFYLNDTASTPVHSTGRKTDNCPFYGTDRFGRPQFFTYNANESWNEISSKFTNGNNYKFKITQWYEGKDEIMSFEMPDVWRYDTGWVGFPQNSERTGYISFDVDEELLNVQIYYSFNSGLAWFYKNNSIVFFNVTRSNNANGGTQRLGVGTYGLSDPFVQQPSFSDFITCDTPTLALQISGNENFVDPIALGDTLATSIGYFVADYQQEQGDPIRWIRWQVATATYNSETKTWILGDILEDTGDIYTPTLNFEFNGFFNGRSYAIRCFGESESGQSCDTSWHYFTINIENQEKYTGTFAAQCLNKENATLLKWDSVTVIPPTVNPEDYKPTTSNGAVTLNANSSITWNKVGNGSSQTDMNFQAPLTIVWRGMLYNTSLTTTQRLTFSQLVQPYSSATATQEVPFNKKIISVSNTTTNGIVNIEGNQISVTFFNRTAFSRTISTELIVGVCDYINGNLLQLNSGDLSISFLSNKRSFVVEIGSTSLELNHIDNSASQCAVILSPNQVTVISYFDNNTTTKVDNAPIVFNSNINSVSIYGGDSGATVESVSVYQGDGSNVLSLYENPNFEPIWNSNDYQLYMTANFNGNLEGGTGTASGAGFRVYRQEVGKSVLTPIATVSSTTTSLKDYGISSRKAYKYSLYAYDSNGAFMSAVEADNAIATNFKNYSLLVCDYDYDKDEYHVRKQYLFALNLTSGSVGNNNSPTLNKNFTQYPTRMSDTANYASGTLQGLIGAIYTVPALIEQIGQYKYTAKPSTLDYFDSVDVEKELYDLSTAPYQLFLRDMKGRLRMIHTNGAISMTTNIKQKQQSISISFPWVEIGDASDVTIIQTPEDYGWNNDNQVLDVQLDVDVATGELSATYPFPYNGTKFYLTGVNKENLTAKTPLGTTPAQFNLSDTATETTDGEVTATVTVNSEVNK